MATILHSVKFLSSPRLTHYGLPRKKALSYFELMYIDWIKRGLQKPGKSRIGLARHLGVTSGQITHLLKGDRRLKADLLPKISAYLGEPLPTNKNVIPPAEQAEQKAYENVNKALPEGHLTVTLVPVVGEVAAGVWRESDAMGYTGKEPQIPIVPLGYPHSKQFAYHIIGNSMNQMRMQGGDYVVCVPYFERRSEITDGDFVVVERRNGQLTERTLKIVRVMPDGYQLEPRSSEPGHKPIFVPRNFEPVDGIEVEIVGYVVGGFIPFD